MDLRKALLATIVWLLAAAAGHAATLNVVNGQLVGAEDVNVDGTLYDVLFAGGVCQSLYDGCDDTSDFTFQSQSAAVLASIALFNQVFDKAPFDTGPQLTRGCSFSASCDIITPYTALVDGSGDPVAYQASVLTNIGVPGSLILSDQIIGVRDGRTILGQATFAVWSSSVAAVIPLPAGFVLLLTGIATLAGLQWRRKRSAAV